MSLNTCFDWFEKLRLFSYVQAESENRRRSQGVACRCHPTIFFKWGTFGVIYIYFRLFTLFWKNKYIFQYHSQKMFELIYKDWSKLFVRFIRNNLNQVVHTLA
jgi:hypothetical protein